MLTILFENDDLLAVDKPEGLAATAEQAGKGECLLSQLSAQLSERLYVVHRLDREASGVILFARNAAADKWLSEQFANRSVKRAYAALTHGAVGQDRGAIDKPLRQFDSGRMGVDLRRGRPALTEFLVTERFREYTLLLAYPRTVRRHQIRAHLYSIGHPVVGDLRYGEKALQGKFPRLMLHAQGISLRLATGEPITVKSPLPPSFLAVLETIRSQ